MYHLPSILMGGLAAVGAWALVAPSSAPAHDKSGIGGADVQALVNSAQGDRLAARRLQRLEVPRGVPVPPPIPKGCDPVVSRFVQPGLFEALAHQTGHCVT